MKKLFVVRFQGHLFVVVKAIQIFGIDLWNSKPMFAHENYDCCLEFVEEARELGRT